MSISMKLWEDMILFETSVNLNNPNSCRVREERRQVEKSLMDQQSLLGVSCDGETGQVVELRTKVSTKNTSENKMKVLENTGIGVGEIVVGRISLPMQKRPRPRQGGHHGQNS